MPQRHDDIAIIGWSDLADGAPHRQDRGADAARGDHRRGRADAGITRAEVDFTCAGSCDYVAGAGVLVRAEHRRHRRVAAQARLARRDGRRVGDVRGVAPPAARRHRRSRWRWAPAGRRPPTPRSSTRWRWTRTTSRRSAPTPSSFAALQARALIDAGKVTERADGRGRGAQPARRARSNPHAQVTGDFDVDELLAEDYVRAPLRRHDLPPITDGACAVVIARADKARELCEQPGVDHRLRPLHRAATNPAMRDLTDVAVDHARRRRPPGSATGPIEVAEIQAAFTHEEPLLRRGARPRRPTSPVNPSGGAAGRQPDHGHRPRAHRRGGARRSATAASSARSRTPRRVRACNRTSSASWKGTLSEPPALRDRRHRPDPPQERAAGTSRSAASSARPRTRALDDAADDWADIDAVVVGKAPDLFEGVMKPELYLTDALGATGKPMFRVHTAGSVGGTTGIVASHHVETGRAQARARRRATRSSRRATRSSRSARGRGASHRRRRRVRAVHALLHRTAAARPSDIGPHGRGEGPPERAEEPVRAPEAPGHLAREGARRRR